MERFGESVGWSSWRTYEMMVHGRVLGDAATTGTSINNKSAVILLHHTLQCAETPPPKKNAKCAPRTCADDRWEQLRCSNGPHTEQELHVMATTV